MNLRTSRVILGVAVMGTAMALSGCSTLREAAGMEKEPPDEFAVLTKAPLVIPPDYNLRPPRPGAAPTNQVEPTQAAEQTLFGNDPATVAASMSGNYSPGEKMLLASAGIQNSDPDIRQHLQSDRASMMGADDDFTNEILFWKGPKPDTGTPVNADAEAQRLDQQKAGIASPDSAPKPDTAQPDAQKPEQKDDSGWFGGLFDWL
ncbi:MAG: DUF3035 domain-containing protein [Alphaproteobacteria bacterium]|nr:DUF3035 domain-containing protein [Alphaproteobacteria bacterium]